MANRKSTIRSPTRGGARPGAGRPAKSGRFGEPTRPLRVPESQVSTILAYLDGMVAGDAASAETIVLGVRATEARRSTSIRRFAARVPAGFPSPAADYEDDPLDFNARLIAKGHEAATFVVRVSGWSMVGAGVSDGDEVVVDRAITPRDGHVVVAALNGELVVKRLRIRGGKMMLVSENPHYPERVLVAGDELVIWGVATNVLHALL